MLSNNFYKKSAIAASIIWAIGLFSHEVPMHQGSYDFVSVDYVLQKNPRIRYQKCLDPVQFDYGPFPLSQWPDEQPHKGTFAELFVLTIPQGRVASDFGIVLIDDRCVLRELAATSYRFCHYVNLVLWANFGNVRKVPGKVAVIAKMHAQCYAHWLTEVLGRLAILESLGIEYDWLYVPFEKTEPNKEFVRETLRLWGIKPNQIIEPYDEFYCIQADELIVPSLPNRRIPTPGEPFCDSTLLCAAYPHEWVIHYLRKKFLPMAEKHKVSQNFSKRIFISRKDGGRKISNEDEIFNLFEGYGFERYELSKLSFLDQVKLFAQADIVVGFHGSGLANSMFCKTTACVVEIFQARSDSVNYNIAQIVGLDYQCIKTTEFDFFGHFNTQVPFHIIQDFISTMNL